MCGIAGVVGVRDRNLVKTLTRALAHRGPDGMACRHEGLLHIGATRLSIMDPGSPSVLLSNEAGTLWIAFNGEIYNHRALRVELESRGHHFATRTDTEVVVHLYEELGDECVSRLHGMFAFAILDRTSIFLARDRLGIKPLYYARIQEPTSGFSFASEIKSLLQCRDLSAQLDMEAFAEFAVISHPVGAHTFITGVKTLPPGHTMRVSLTETGVSASQPKRYYSLQYERKVFVAIQDAEKAVEEKLWNAVESHLVADVEVGVALSGGLDSTTLAFMARRLQNDAPTLFTIADDERHPDMQEADSVAQTLGARHVRVVMTFAEYLEHVPGFITAEERPSRLYALPFYLLCGKIAHHVKTCLNGEGADELFGGYPDHIEPKWRRLGILSKMPLCKKLGVAPTDRLIEVTEALRRPGTRRELIEASFEWNFREALQWHHLESADKCSMAAGLEMRLPYLDDHLCELVNSLPISLLVRPELGIQKYLLRRFCVKHFGNDGLDAALRTKLGGPNAASRLLKRFSRLCENVLPSDYLTRHPLGFCFEEKRDLLAFEIFEEIFCKRRGERDGVGAVMDFLHARSGRSAAQFKNAAAPSWRPDGQQDLATL